MDLLGLSGPAPGDYARALVNDLKALGCNVAAFRHSIDEIRDNLKGLLSQSDRQKHGPTADALRRNQIADAFVRAVFHNVEDHVESAGIPIYDPQRTPLPVNVEQYFSSEAKDRLFQLLQPYYVRDRARDRDIESISVIVKRRAGHRSENVFRSKHILVTSNDMLVASASRLAQEFGASKRDVAPVIHRRRLAALVCISVGPKQRADISRKRLLASCSSALTIRPEILENIRKRLAQVDVARAGQFEILMNQPRFLQLAMDYTFADENIAAQADVTSLFDKLKEELTAEERARTNKRLRQQREKHTGELLVAKSAVTKGATDAAIERTKHEALLKAAIRPYFKFWQFVRNALGRLIVGGAIAITILFTLFSGSNWLWSTTAGLALLIGYLVVAVVLAVMTLFSWGIDMLMRPLAPLQRLTTWWALRRFQVDSEVKHIDYEKWRIELNDGRIIDIRE